VRSLLRDTSSIRAGDSFSMTIRPPARVNAFIQSALCSRTSIASGETAKRPGIVRNGRAGPEQIVTFRPSILGASACQRARPSACSYPSERANRTAVPVGRACASHSSGVRSE